MFRLALCEDERIFSDAQIETCHAILEKLAIEGQISDFTNSADFIEAFITKGQRFDMILLDIVMDGINGIELAQRIRQVDGDVAIVFITSYSKYAITGYGVNALHYLLKPVNAQLLENLIWSIYIKEFLDEVLTIKSGEHYIRIPIKDIVCMEITGRRVEVSLMDRKVYYQGKLTEILDELPNGIFIQCHQAFAVNIRNVRELTRRNAIAVNGQEIPVSRTFWNNIKSAFMMQLAAV